jgi:hypothetical protein
MKYYENQATKMADPSFTPSVFMINIGSRKRSIGDYLLKLNVFVYD